MAGEDYKARGNERFLAKDYDGAIVEYSRAIDAEPENSVYYTNRSACYFNKKQYDQALVDAQLSIEKDSKFIKGYLRMVAAQVELGRWSDAEATLKTALSIDPTDKLVLMEQEKLKKRKASPSPPQLARSTTFPGASAPGSMSPQHAEANLQQAKALIQHAFRINDFKAALEYCIKAREFSSVLPEPRSTFETTQIMQKQSTLHAQMGDFKEALKLCETCLEKSSAWYSRGGEEKNDALMMVMSCYGMKSNLHLSLGSTSEAESAAKKTMELSNQLFAVDDPRRFRAMRCVAQVHEKQNRTTEAKEGFNAAYELLVSRTNPTDPELLMAVDELINCLMNISKGAPDSPEVTRAIMVAQRQVDDLRSLRNGNSSSSSSSSSSDSSGSSSSSGGKKPPSAARSDEEKKRDEMILGDCSWRLAAIKVHRDPAEAEVAMRETLAIREKHLGPDAAPVAQTLLAVSEFMEMQGKIGPECEMLLERAIKAYEKSEGPKSSAAAKIKEKIERIRARREGKELPYTIDEQELSLSSGNSSFKDSPASNGAKPGMSRANTAPPGVGDPALGIELFQRAVKLLQDEKNNKIEEALPAAFGALQIFSKHYGEEDQRTIGESRHVYRYFVFLP